MQPDQVPDSSASSESLQESGLPALKREHWELMVQTERDRLEKDICGFYRDRCWPTCTLSEGLRTLECDEPLATLQNLLACRYAYDFFYKPLGWKVEALFDLVSGLGSEKAGIVIEQMVHQGARPDLFPIDIKSIPTDVIQAFGTLVSGISFCLEDLPEADPREALKETAEIRYRWLGGLIELSMGGNTEFRSHIERIVDLKEKFIQNCEEFGWNATTSLASFFSLLSSPRSRETPDALDTVAKWLQAPDESTGEVFGEMCYALGTTRDLSARMTLAKVFGLMGPESRKTSGLPQIAKQLLTRRALALTGDSTEQLIPAEQFAEGLKTLIESDFPSHVGQIPLSLFTTEEARRNLPLLGKLLNRLSHVYTEDEKIEMGLGPSTSVILSSGVEDELLRTSARALFVDPSGGLLVQTLDKLNREVTPIESGADSDQTLGNATLVREELRKIDEAFLESSLDRLARIRSDEEQSLLIREMGRDIRSDVPPTADPVTQRQVMREVMRVVRRGLEPARGFKALTPEARTLIPGEDWLLVQAAKALSPRVDYLDANKSDVAPGKGIVISGFPLENVFAADPREKDPFHQIRDALLWAGGELDDLPFTKFIFSRGLIGVIAPDKPRYCLDGVHFSYLIFNDHAFNPNRIGVLSPPTEFLQRLLSRGVVSKEKIAGSLHSRGFRSDQILASALSAGIPVLHLTAPANLAGLNKAYPSRFAPHYEWENHVRGTRDSSGHVHTFYYQFLNDLWNDEERRQALHDQRGRNLALHDSVVQFATRYQNLFDLGRIALSYWRKGWAGGEQSPDPESVADALFPEFEDPSEEPRTTRETRMLEKAYQIHRAMRERGEPRSSYPVLMVLPVLDWWSNPSSPVSLDTYDMSLRVSEKLWKLPVEGDGRGDRESHIWLQEVVPYFRTDTEPRFVHRPDLDALTA